MPHQEPLPWSGAASRSHQAGRHEWEELEQDAAAALGASEALLAVPVYLPDLTKAGSLRGWWWFFNLREERENTICWFTHLCIHWFFVFSSQLF